MKKVAEALRAVSVVWSSVFCFLCFRCRQAELCSQTETGEVYPTKRETIAASASQPLQCARCSQIRSQVT